MRLFSVNTNDGSVHWFGASYKGKKFITETNREARISEKDAKKRKIHDDRPWNQEDETPIIIKAEKKVHIHIIEPGKDPIIEPLNSITVK